MLENKNTFNLQCKSDFLCCFGPCSSGIFAFKIEASSSFIEKAVAVNFHFNHILALGGIAEKK